MPLEACILILDNSEWSRNGDYAPDRFGAQTDAINVIFNSKTGSNPESTVGLMSMAGQSPQVLATLTHDLGKLLSGLKGASIGGNCDFITAINVAQLALKHRENKNQRQRIITFVGSPIVGGEEQTGIRPVTEEALIKLGKKLRKNNVAVDIITFGEEAGQGETVLQKFVDTVGSESSHLVSIPTGAHLMSDIVARSEVLAAERAARGGGSGAGGAVGGSGGMPVDDFGAEIGGGQSGGDDFGGVDPDMDPELAMAIRMSIQEEEERQRRAAGPASTTASTEPAVPTGDSDSNVAPAPAAPISAETLTHPPAVPVIDVSMDDAAVSDLSELNTDMAVDEDMVEEGDDDEDEEMLRAIAMSMESQNQGKDGEDESK